MKWRLGLLEIFLLQVIVYAVIWLWDEYVATYVCIVIPAVIGAALLLSLIVELIEPSKVPRRFFTILFISVLAPIITGVAFVLLYQGNLTWLDQ